MKILIGCFFIISCAIKNPDDPFQVVQNKEIYWKIYEDTDKDGVNDLLEYSLGFNPYVADVDEFLVKPINLMAEKINSQVLKERVFKYSSGNFTTGELNTMYDIENTRNILRKKLGIMNVSSKIYILLVPTMLIRPDQETKIHTKKFPVKEIPLEKLKVQCYYSQDKNDHILFNRGQRKTLPCDAIIPDTPLVAKRPCVVTAYSRPDFIWTPFKISQELDILNTLRIKIGNTYFDLNELEKYNKIRFHWIADYHPDGFSEKLLIVIHDLSLITDIEGDVQVEILSSAKSKKFYHGIETSHSYRDECLEFAFHVGGSYGLIKGDLKKDKIEEIDITTMGDGYKRYPKDYAISIYSIISNKKDNL